MKVLLLKDVKGVGHKNDVKDVADGYGQNFLIGRGFAKLATTAMEEQAAKLSKERIVKQEQEVFAIESALKKLKGDALIIHATANEKDHLFEAVHPETIAAHVRDVVGVDVASAAIVIDTPIKELGEYTVHVAVGGRKVPVLIRIENK